MVMEEASMRHMATEEINTKHMILMPRIPNLTLQKRMNVTWILRLK